MSLRMPSASLLQPVPLQRPVPPQPPWGPRRVPAVAVAFAVVPVPAALLANLRTTVSEASVLLLVGGMSMLTFILVLVLIQTLVPERGLGVTGELGAQPGRELRPMGGGIGAGAVPAGAATGRRRRARRGDPWQDSRLNDALDRIIALGIGEPRLLVARQHEALLRLYGCRGCGGVPGASEIGPGCPGERKAVEEILQQTRWPRCTVQESACCRAGAPACEFEVQA